jgi:hypothetical protein
MTDETKGGDVQRAARLFDVRRVIGGLFVVYGVIVTLLGIFDSQEEIDKAQGLRINLWMGLAMLVFGLLMLLWAFTRPLAEELGTDEQARRAAGSDDEGIVGKPDPRRE